MTGHRTTTLAGLAIMILAACGGPAATPGPGATSAPGATTGAATAGPNATTGTSPTGAPVVTEPGGFGTATTACELLTTEEAAASLGSGPLTATGGDQAGLTFCDYRSASGEAVLTTYMQPSGAGALWSVYKSSLTTEPVAGLGDEAMYEPSTKLLFVLKGDAFFNLFVAEVGLSAEQALEKEKPLATIMVGRL